MAVCADYDPALPPSLPAPSQLGEPCDGRRPLSPISKGKAKAVLGKLAASLIRSHIAKTLIYRLTPALQPLGRYFITNFKCHTAN